MRARGGAIVNMSSIYGMAGKAAHHAYVASKHAVIGMTRSVAIELAPRGVRVNAICAGLTATAGVRAAESVVPEVVAALVAEHPTGRMASEDEIGERGALALLALRELRHGRRARGRRRLSRHVIRGARRLEGRQHRRDFAA